MPKPSLAELPEFSNIANFESLLKSRYRSSLTAKKYTIDISKTKWIGPLQICLLYGWLQDLLEQGTSVTLKIGNNSESQAIWFMSNAGFFEKLSDKIDVDGLPARNRNAGLCAFKTFANMVELESYKSALTSPQTSQLLLNSGDDVDIVRDGDLRDILINELCQNGLIHGESKHVRYSVSEFPQEANRLKHRFLSGFSGKSYVEVAVSDSGKGIAATLSHAVPYGYQPIGTNSTGVFSDVEKLVSFAFEFSSTSDVDTRRARLDKLLAGDVIEYEAIPTGLFYVYSLVKSYGGQIVLRTSDFYVSIDLANPAVPLFFTKSNLTCVPGTHLLVRFPRERNKVIPKITKKEYPSYNTTMRFHHSVVLVHLPQEPNIQSKLLCEIENAVALKIDQCSKLLNPVISLLMYGLPLETKAFAVLLTILSAMPRKNCALLAMGIPRDLLDPSTEQWRKILDLRKNGARTLDRVHGFRSILLVSDDLTQLAEFGDTAQTDATCLSGGSATGPFLFTKDDIVSSHSKAISNGLSQLIQSDHVKHPGNYYYLIENKYYTETFFQISKLLAHPTGKHLAFQFIRLLTENSQIGVVYNISEPLNAFTLEISKSITTVRFVNRVAGAELSTAMHALLSSNKSSKIAILSDVICTATEIQDVFELVSDLERSVAICFVDARDDEFDYVSVKRKDRAYSVKVLAALRFRISPIYDLPKETSKPILTIDRRTHTPTSYDEIKNPPNLSPEDLLKTAIQSEALYQGHFDYFSKHYSIFLYFPALFYAISRDLFVWWDNILKELHDRKLQSKDITVLYLDEKKGWEPLIHEYLIDKGISNILPISHDLLDAPPVDVVPTRCVWFIIPAIASGNTTNKCLEIASRFAPETIRILIILARIDSASLSFYQNISGYKDCADIKVSMMTWMPITSYASDTACPMCNALKLIENIRVRVSEYHSLHEATKRPFDLFTCVKIDTDDFKAAMINSLRPVHHHFATLRAHYEEARRNIGHRRKVLGPLLEGSQMCRYFIEMVGNEFLSPAFDPEEVKRVTYTKFDQLEREALEIITNHPYVHLSLTLLLGIHRIFPVILARQFPDLILQALHSPGKELFDDLVFLSLLDPLAYAPALVSQTNLASPSIWFQGMMKDIREFPHWFDTPESYSVSSYFHLLWLLRRSTPFGMNLEYLRGILRNTSSSNEEIRKTFNILKTEGVNVILADLARLTERDSVRPGGLWSSLLAHDQALQYAPTRLRTICSDFESLSTKSNLSRQELLTKLDSLDTEASHLVESLTALFTNPIDAQIRIQDMLADRWQSSPLKIEFTIDKHQPGILFSLDDLVQCICYVIDNAVQFVATNVNFIVNTAVDVPVIRFHFSGYTPDRHASALQISDNLAWDKKISPDGGLKQFGECCRKYGAIYDFDPKLNGEPHDARIKVIFRIDKESLFNV